MRGRRAEGLHCELEQVHSQRDAPQEHPDDPPRRVGVDLWCRDRHVHRHPPRPDLGAAQTHVRHAALLIAFELHIPPSRVHEVLLDFLGVLGRCADSWRRTRRLCLAGVQPGLVAQSERGPGPERPAALVVVELPTFADSDPAVAARHGINQPVPHARVIRQLQVRGVLDDAAFLLAAAAKQVGAARPLHVQGCGFRRGEAALRTQLEMQRRVVSLGEGPWRQIRVHDEEIR
mmetsp:Transcript_76591/g.234517  ORF Transcript_76591/g.234517 Transcript_76591/m.234517 type:complete len:232 (+) Transcript_76591:1498-2193(+)